MTVFSLNTPFDNLPCLPTLSDQAVNVSNADNFAPNPRSRSLSYHRCCPRHSLYQAVNISSIDKPINRRSRSTSSSTSSQTPVDTDTSRIHNPRLRYFCNFCYYLHIANSLKTMN